MDFYKFLNVMSKINIESDKIKAQLNFNVGYKSAHTPIMFEDIKMKDF